MIKSRSADATVSLPASEIPNVRDALFAPLASWGKFRRLHAFHIDHQPACTGPRDSEDAKFSVRSFVPQELDKTMSDVVGKVKSLMPQAVVAAREHQAICPHCKAVLKRRSMLVSVPKVDEATGVVDRASREYAL